MSSAPLIRRLQATIPAQTATTAADQSIGEAPFAGTLTSATFTPEAAITGATSTARTFTIVNKGLTGAGTTVMATLAYITSTNGVAFDEQAFTLSAVAGATTVAAGDILVCAEADISTGTASPGGMVALEITRA